MVRAIEKILGKPLERRQLAGFDYTVPAPAKDTEFARPPRQPVVRRAKPAAPAAATPPAGTDVQTLSRNVVDGTEYTVTRITVAPGGGTGWHYHPGEVS